MSALRGRLGTRLRDLRRAKRLTQEQLAEQAGLSYKFIGEIERGRGNPTVDTLGALGHALGVEIPELFGLSENRRPTRLAYTLPGQPLLCVREALELLEAALDQVESDPTSPKRRRRKR